MPTCFVFSDESDTENNELSQAAPAILGHRLSIATAFLAEGDNILPSDALSRRKSTLVKKYMLNI